MTSKVLCVTCVKSVGQFKCEGCLQAFCMKHAAEHRQGLQQQLDAVGVDHDLFHHMILQDKIKHEQLVNSIEKWETESIEKIRKIAQETRQKVEQFTQLLQSQFISLVLLMCDWICLFLETIVERLEELKNEIKKAREDEDFFESNIREWSAVLEQLKVIKSDTSSRTIKEDSEGILIRPIQFLSVSSIPKKLPSRLEYTNKDGIYVNPRSFLVTPIWYFYSPQRNGWFWTPYNNHEVWMSVMTLIVSSGSYKNQKPATVNIEIINYLEENNPLPPENILREAYQAEDRILKL